jgi:hypothetical protein
VDGEVVQEDYSDANCATINPGNERVHHSYCEDNSLGSTISGCSTKDPYDSVPADIVYVFNT